MELALKALAALATATVMVVAFVRSRVVRSGTIVALRHHEEREDFMMQSVGSVMVPTCVTHPEHWTVTIEGKRRNGRTGRWSWEVSREEWEDLWVGGWWSR